MNATQLCNCLVVIWNRSQQMKQARVPIHNRLENLHTACISLQGYAPAFASPLIAGVFQLSVCLIYILHLIKHQKMWISHIPT